MKRLPRRLVAEPMGIEGLLRSAVHGGPRGRGTGSVDHAAVYGVRYVREALGTSSRTPGTTYQYEIELI